jgi:hypothetical protein
MDGAPRLFLMGLWVIIGGELISKLRVGSQGVGFVMYSE